MAGICSAHSGYEKDCWACNALPQDLFPNWNEKVAKAEAAGVYTCQKCQFVYFKTIDACPRCGEARCE